MATRTLMEAGRILVLTVTLLTSHLVGMMLPPSPESLSTYEQRQIRAEIQYELDKLNSDP